MARSIFGGKNTSTEIATGVDASTAATTIASLEQKKKVLHEEFFTNAAISANMTQANGSGGGASYDTALGVYELHSGVTSGINSTLESAKFFSFPTATGTNKTLVLDFMMYVSDQDSVAANSFVGFGATGANGLTANTFGIRMKTAGSPATWEWYVDAAGTETTSDVSSTFADGDFNQIRIEMSSASIKCYLNGVLDATLSTNLITAVNGGFFRAEIRNTAADNAIMGINNLQISEIE